MTTTRRRPRHNSAARSAQVARTFTSYTVTCMGAVALGETSVGFSKVLRKFTAEANLYGRSCSGVGMTAEEAIERAKAVCEEREAKRAA